MKCTQHFKICLHSGAFLIFKPAKSLGNFSLQNRNQSNDKVFFDDIYFGNEFVNTAVKLGCFNILIHMGFLLDSTWPK